MLDIVLRRLGLLYWLLLLRVGRREVRRATCGRLGLVFRCISVWLRVGRDQSIVVVRDARVAFEEIPSSKGRPAEANVGFFLGICRASSVSVPAERS